MKLYLSGCAGLHHMMFGVCSYIEEHYNLDNIDEIRTISGSNYVGAALISNYSTRSIWKLWSKRLSTLIKQYPITFSFKLYEMIKHHSNDVLKNFPNKKIRKHYILITNLFKLKKRWVKKFLSTDDYCNCIIAGSYIPFISGITKICYNYKNMNCIDSGLLNFCITKKKSSNTNTLKIDIDDFLSVITKIEYYKWLISGLISTRKHHKIQFKKGYLYARLFLQDKLDKHLTKRTSESKKYLTITGKLEWNRTDFN